MNPRSIPAHKGLGQAGRLQPVGSGMQGLPGAACLCAACTALVGPLHLWGWAPSQVRLLTVIGEERDFCFPRGRG